MRQTAATTASGNVLHNVGMLSLSRYEDSARHVALEEANGCLVQVDPKNCFAIGNFALTIIPPLPHRECLRMIRWQQLGVRGDHATCTGWQAVWLAQPERSGTKTGIKFGAVFWT
jgi:hypothetical protein